jgi:hypothetical protein
MRELSQNKESTFLWKGIFAQYLAKSFHSRVDRNSNLRSLELSWMRLAAREFLLQPSLPFGRVYVHSHLGNPVLSTQARAADLS